MKNIFLKHIVFTSVFLVGPSIALAMNMELGLNYSYKKTLVDQNNSTEQQGITGSISFYLWERVALETSYTNSLYVKREKIDSLLSGSSQRTTTQFADIYGADLIYVLADRKAPLQPHIKGGLAYVKKRQTSQTDNQPMGDPIEPKPGWAPSYGVGLKFFLTEAIAIKISYDVVRTPIDDTTFADDVGGRVGLSWML